MRREAGLTALIVAVWLLLWYASAWGWGVAMSSGGKTCSINSLFKQTDISDFNGIKSATAYTAQQIKIAAATTVCGVEAHLYETNAATVTMHFEFWSDNARAVTKYGQTSTVTINGDTPGSWYYFSVASPFAITCSYPCTVYMHAVQDTGSELDIKWQRSADGNNTAYENTDYDAYRSDTSIDADFSLRIYTQ